MHLFARSGFTVRGWAVGSDCGWITTELFLAWFEKFAHFSKARKDSPVLLIQDGHSTLTKSLKIIEFARDNGVVFFYLLTPYAGYSRLM